VSGSNGEEITAPAVAAIGCGCLIVGLLALAWGVVLPVIGILYICGGLT
jgi:hypothetical protein